MGAASSTPHICPTSLFEVAAILSAGGDDDADHIDANGREGGREDSRSSSQPAKELRQRSVRVPPTLALTIQVMSHSSRDITSGSIRK